MKFIKFSFLNLPFYRLLIFKNNFDRWLNLIFLVVFFINNILAQFFMSQFVLFVFFKQRLTSFFDLATIWIKRLILRLKRIIFSFQLIDSLLKGILFDKNYPIRFIKDVGLLLESVTFSYVCRPFYLWAHPRTEALSLFWVYEPSAISCVDLIFIVFYNFFNHLIDFRGTF